MRRSVPSAYRSHAAIISVHLLLAIVLPIAVSAQSVVEVGTIRAFPGEEASLEVRITGALPNQTTGIEQTLVFPSDLSVLMEPRPRGGERVACHVGADVILGMAGFRVNEVPCADHSGGCQQLDVLLISFHSASWRYGTTIYRCNVAITATAVPSVVPIPCLETTIATDEADEAIPLSCADGQVIIDQCYGDCDRDGTLSIAELVHGVQIALGLEPNDCRGLDEDADGEVTITELIRVVRVAMEPCGPPIEP